MAFIDKRLVGKKKDDNFKGRKRDQIEVSHLFLRFKFELIEGSSESKLQKNSAVK